MQKPRALWQSLIVATWRREPRDRAIQQIFDYLCNRAVFFSPALFMKISNFSKTVHTIFTKSCTVILHQIRVLYVQWHQNRMTGM